MLSPHGLVSNTAYTSDYIASNGVMIIDLIRKNGGEKKLWYHLMYSPSISPDTQWNTTINTSMSSLCTAVQTGPPLVPPNTSRLD
jgi:hypothetical protein